MQSSEGSMKKRKEGCTNHSSPRSQVEASFLAAPPASLSPSSSSSPPASTAMAVIQDLPPEILHRIIDLADYVDCRDVWQYEQRLRFLRTSLCLVARAWIGPAQQLMLHDLKLLNYSVKSAALLARLTEPDDSRMVKRLAIDGTGLTALKIDWGTILGKLSRLERLVMYVHDPPLEAEALREDLMQGESLLRNRKSFYELPDHYSPSQISSTFSLTLSLLQTYRPLLRR